VISYEDLDLRIQADGASFAVFARHGSQSASEPFDLDPSLPCDLEDLETRGATEIERCGSTLFEALIRDRVRDLYQQGRGGSGSDPTKGLRVRILIDPRDERLRPFARMPWELLFDRNADTNRWLALDARRPIVRMIDSIEQPLAADVGDLQRVLLALANPAGTEQLDLERECAAVEESLIRNRVRPQIVRRATRSALHKSISDSAPQVVHFMGHGDLDSKRGEGVLVLEDEDNEPDVLDASTLASFFVGRPAPRLVILTSCLTAVVGRERVFSAFSSVAAALVAAGLPAVIAMQSEVRDHNAIRFTERLYRRVIAKDPVEAAVSEARVALRGADRYTLDWAAPVLYVGAQETARSSEPTPPTPPQIRMRDIHGNDGIIIGNLSQSK
jgi:hypothetical protein